MRIVIDTQEPLESQPAALDVAEATIAASMLYGGAAPNHLIARGASTLAAAPTDAGGPSAHLVQLFEAQKLAEGTHEEKAEPARNEPAETKSSPAKRRRTART